MKAGLAVTAADARGRLFTVRGLITDALKVDANKADPHTKALTQVAKLAGLAIEEIDNLGGKA